MDSFCYVQDIYLKEMLFAVTVRSHIAKGRLKEMNCPKLPAGYYIIRAGDITGKNQLADSNLPILAGDELSYIGEPVAILAGPDKARLEDFASQCSVIAEEEEPVFTYDEADENMVIAKRDILFGNPEDAFSRAAKIIESVHHTGIQEHWYSEPVGAVSWYREDNPNVMVVRTASQWLNHVKRTILENLEIEPDSLHVEPTITGLHLDGKLWYPSLVACHAALGTLITKKPVRLIFTREEDFLYTPKRCQTSINISSALDDKDNITGAKINICVNLGGYGVNAEELLDQTCLGSLGVYQHDALSLSAKAYKTNIPPQGPFNGFGLSSGFFSMENHISLIADKVRQSPLSLRDNNFNINGALSFLLSCDDSKRAKELLGNAASMSDYFRKNASYELLRHSRGNKAGNELNQRDNTSWTENIESHRGIGISLGYQGNDLLYCRAGVEESFGIQVTLTKDSELEIRASSISSEEEYCRTWTDMAAEILSIEPGMVHIINTFDAPDCGPSCASRNITVITSLIESCCLAIRQQRFRDPLPITIRATVDSENSPSWKEIFKPLVENEINTSGFSKPGLAAAVVEVEIDPVQYIPIIRGVWISVYGGKIINMDYAKRNLTAGAAQALGWSYGEIINYEDGTLSRNQFKKFTIPDAGSIPQVNIDFHHDNSKEARGIGELPFNCIPSAFLQAVSQAADHHFSSIPLLKDDIWKALNKEKEMEIL
ncbi:MAG: molybdopterin-dependent oxidoreductase [Treponema sp.]|nr:molybdopterin-dependent oxidoreductase [Treponema sp.]